MNAHISDARIGGGRRLAVLYVSSKILMGVSGETDATGRYVSTEYLFGVLFTSFANQHAIYGYSVCLAAGATLVVVFSLTLLPQERILIGNEQFVMEIWNNVVLLWRSVQVDNIDLFTRYAIGKLLDSRLVMYTTLT